MAQSDAKMMIIVIDGARYTETFGDPAYTWIPEMGQLFAEGTVVHEFRNDGITYTSRAIPALWCGAWTAVRDTVFQGIPTQYSVKPSIFEYYRKHLQQPDENCYYVLKFISGLWLPSFDPGYGPAYWPSFYSEGDNDEDVCNNTKNLMVADRPDFIWVYLADVDHAGHSGNWNYYTSTLRKADSIVGVLWDHAQSLPYYKDKTTMFVTNDHGRHDDQHGGFQDHGCGCEGCRRIQLLAIGPDIRQSFLSTRPRVLPDMAVTAAHILGFEMEKATGQVMYEILSTSYADETVGHYATTEICLFPNPFSGMATLRISTPTTVTCSAVLFDLFGNVKRTIEAGVLEPDSHYFSICKDDVNEDNLEPGVYLLVINLTDSLITRKVLVY